MNIEIFKKQLNVKHGISTRADFPLVISKTAFLVIDIQDHLSSKKKHAAKRESESESKPSGTDDQYLFDQALPKVIPNIVELLNCARSIRDCNTTTSHQEDDYNHNLPGCEVVITFLQAHTPDCRDVSLDYKLSGPKLATLPNSTNLASFDALPIELRPSSTGRGDIILPKTSCSVFQSTNLRYILSNLGVRQLVVCGQLTDQCVMSAVRDAADLGYLVTVVEDACAAMSEQEHERGILGMKGFARILSTRQVINELEQQCREESKSEGDQKEGQKDIIIDKPLHEFNYEILDDEHESQKFSATKVQVSHLPEASSWKPQNAAQNQGAIDALLHTLRFANIKFLRFGCVDVSNSIRTKMVPMKRLITLNSSARHNGSMEAVSYGCTSTSNILDHQVSVAKATMIGPTYADTLIAGTHIDARDVLMIRPDLSSLRILPYVSSSAMVFGTLHDQRTCQLSDLCSRGLLARVIATADEKLGIGFAVGVEIEFCLVKEVEEGDTQIVAPDSSLFAGTTTLNDQDAFISDLYNCLEKQDINLETIHAESAAGQMEVVLPYEYDAMKIADDVVLTRESIKACAKKHRLEALFQPKVYDDQAGNGMHIHMSINNKRSKSEPFRNIFPGSGPSGISDTGQSFIEGILTHLESLVSITLPMPNSFARVGKECWTGHTVGWDVEDKESPVRVCLDSRSCKATNVELKLIDNSCNIYLALASIFWAGFDGILCEMNLRPALREETIIQNLPSNLEDSLAHLEKSKLFRDLFGQELFRSYLAVKRAEIEHSMIANPTSDNHDCDELIELNK